MTTETQEVQNDVTVETENKNDNTNVADKATLEAELEATRAELAKNADLLAKVRKFEKENKEAAEKALKEQGKFKELFEEEHGKRQSLESKLKDKLIGDVLTQTLAEAKAKDVKTAMKLVDKSKIVVGEDFEVDVSTVKLVVADLVKSDPVLFGVDEEVNTDKKKENVDVKRVAETSTISSYEKEIRTAKSMKEIEAVMKKYGKM